LSEPKLDRLAEYFRSDSPRGVVAVYLFGSHAAGRAHRESDVDIGVLLDRSRYPGTLERGDARIRLTADLIHVTGTNEVDVVILNDAPPLLGRHIVNSGILVFCADPEADRIFVRDVQLRAADLAPWLQRMRQIKLRMLRQ
jgi:uncharacterized protein